MGPGIQVGEQQRDPVSNNVDSLKWPSDLHKAPVENKFLCAHTCTRILLFFIFFVKLRFSVVLESTDK